jgi:hypothetical protein
MYNPRFDNATNHCADEGDREGIVDRELKISAGIISAVMRQDVQKRSYKIQILSRDVGHLKYRTYPLADKLSCRIDTFLTVSNEDGDFASSWRFKDFGDLLDGLLENIGRADIDFGDDDHDWDI